MTAHSWERSRPATIGGFTYIEVLIVLLIFGAIVSLAYYRTGPALERARVNRVAALLAADLQYAQVVAARQRRPVAVIVTPSVQAYQIRDAQSTTVFRERYVGPDTDYGIETLTVSPTTVEIYPNGATAQTVTFTVGLNGRLKVVKFTRAGQIRVT